MGECGCAGVARPGQDINDLSKPPLDVILRPLVFWIGEDLFAGCEFHQLALEEKGGVIRCAGCLLN